MKIRKYLAVLLVCLFLSGCAVVTVEPQTGRVTTMTCLKEVKIDRLDYVQDANGVRVSLSGVSNVSSYADSIIAAVMAVLTGVLSQ
jgi:hypothetical protein